MSRTNDEIITDDDRLLRRVIYVDPRHLRDDGTPSSLAFKLKKGESGLSVNLERLTTYAKSICEPDRFRLYALRVKNVRKLDLECMRDPQEDNPAHSLILGPFSNAIPKKLSKLAEKIDYPSGKDASEVKS